MCEDDKCRLCKENAHLISNGTCLCDEGYNYNFKKDLCEEIIEKAEKCPVNNTSLKLCLKCKDNNTCMKCMMHSTLQKKFNLSLR